MKLTRVKDIAQDSNRDHYLKEELYGLIKTDSYIFDFIQEAALDGIWFWDLLDPDNVWMNPRYWTLFGYDPATKPHKTDAWQEIVFKEDLKNIYANFTAHAEDPSVPYDQIVRFKHKLGHTVWVRCRGVMLRDDQGKPIKMLGAHTDITNIKEKEEELRLQSAFFEHIIDGTGLGTWKWNVKTGETILNERWAEMIGYTLEELKPISLGTWLAHSTKEDQDRSNELLKEHFEKRTPFYECEFKMKHKNGEWIWVLDRGKVVSWDEEGNPEWMLGAHTDITEIKKKEEELRIQSAIFEHIIDGTDLGTWQWNPETGETIFNERWAEIIGYTLDEIGPISIDTWVKYTHPDDIQKSNTYLEEYFKGNTPIYECEVRMKHKNGGYVWILTKGKVVSWHEKGKPEWVFGSHQDITEKKQDFERNRLFIEQAPSAIAMFDKKMNYLAASQKWFQIYDIEGEDIIGKSYYTIFSKVSKIRKMNIAKCLKGTVIKNYEEKIHRKKGDFVWLSWELRPWYSDENEIGGIIIHVSDITRIKKEEELKSLLRVAEDQNRRLKNFAHIVSHNLKSHSGNFEMLLDLFLQENPEIRDNEIIRLFKTASLNLSDTIAHLNEVVLINTSLDKSLVPIDLKEAIDEVIRGVSAIAIESEVAINNQINDNIRVMAVPAYLDSILLNFITNGIKYRSLERESYLTLSAVKEDKYMVLSIEDNGLGIDLRKHRSKLFGMYKTFHTEIKNARGIGLFITKNQVEAIGGKIEVSSEVDRGTTFKIYMRYE
ncbi:PAS domain-containing sensor histidine kinase [uncultured Aquimarina sp.]|uniref:PAS domain-containing sensor histidine kinase n=1 Tax=uncultured Aquimarina sp. TaxID=575652 RepID=UPI00260DBE4A|nr:PAS domain-containing sensor histidine kinase [uncultured Aquimarina sp.]